MGYEKLINLKDEQIAMESMLGQRKLTTGEIQRSVNVISIAFALYSHRITLNLHCM
jgi:hypothetical protein